MLLYQAKEIAHSPIFSIQEPVFQICFDDGEVIETTLKKTLYSHYFWRIHREYPELPILKRHHVQSVLNGRPLNSGTHIELLSVILKDCCEHYKLFLPEQTEYLLGMIYEITNTVYNEASKLSEPYVPSLDILDLIEVIEYPPIKEINDNTQPTDISIRETYAKVMDILTNDPALKHNPLVKAVNSKMVNANQVLQCISIRGFPSEVDGTILPVPIMTNYTRGMKTLYNYVAESRSAAKALYFSEAPLKKAEYFARRLQLLCMVVESIANHDCGTDRYLHWRVTPPQKDPNGKVVYSGDLKFMIGKYYLDEETNKLKQITGDDPNLHNKVLKIRTALYCRTHNPHQICEVCFGGLSRNISRYANVGHLCSATMTQQTSQSVLSTKHLDSSSVSPDILLSELKARFFTINKDKDSYLIRKDFKDKNVRIVINRDNAIGLTDIDNIDSIENVNPTRVSAIEYIDFQYRTKNEEIAIPIDISQENRKAVLTMEFLRYLKVFKWRTDNRNNFVFDLTNWDFDLPIFKLPDMEYSFSDHSNQIEKVIESNMKSIAERSTPQSPVSTLQELFVLVNSKLNVNMAALEVIIYATMIADPDDYQMARHSENPVLNVTDTVLRNRSLSPAYAYEKQIEVITSPRSFFKMNRPDSVFDVFIRPKEVIHHYRQKRK